MFWLPTTYKFSDSPLSSMATAHRRRLQAFVEIPPSPLWKTHSDRSRFSTSSDATLAPEVAITASSKVPSGSGALKEQSLNESRLKDVVNVVARKRKIPEGHVAPSAPKKPRVVEIVDLTLDDSDLEVYAVLLRNIYTG